MRAGHRPSFLVELGADRAPAVAPASSSPAWPTALRCGATRRIDWGGDALPVEQICRVCRPRISAIGRNKYAPYPNIIANFRDSCGGRMRLLGEGPPSGREPGAIFTEVNACCLCDSVDIGAPLPHAHHWVARGEHSMGSRRRHSISREAYAYL